MKAITRYKLGKLIKYALLTLAVAWLFTLFSGESVRPYLLAWALLGLWTGVLEEFLFGRKFRSLAVPLQFAGKVLLINMLTGVLMLMAFLFNAEQFLPGLPQGDVPIRMLFVQAAFFKLALRVFVVTSIALLAVQVEELMGGRMLLGILLGRYDRPWYEQRIVLTLDLQASTTLTERLGDHRYFSLLNTTYSLMTDALLRNEAEIHKYVGDEVIFTWPMKVGVRELNCLDLYFDISERIAAHADELKAEFGEVPRFRAAVHGGRVLAVRLGHIKRAIDYSGDVMNTVSRMLGLCKQLDAGLLVSSDLLARMPEARERFHIGPEQVLPVKGRRREVRVHAVHRSKRAD